MNKALYIAILLFICIPCYAQVKPCDRVPLAGEEKELLQELKQTRPGVKKVELMLDLGALYLYLPGEGNNDLDKALAYASQAKQLSSNLNFTDGYNEAMLLISEILIEAKVEESLKLSLDSTLIYVRNTLEQVREVQKIMETKMA